MPVNGILGKKIGMTQVFDEKGEVHPITVLQAGPCVVTQLKTATKDGYDAAQIGLVEFVKASKVTKPQAGHFAKIIWRFHFSDAASRRRQMLDVLIRNLAHRNFACDLRDHEAVGRDFAADDS